MPRFLKLNQFPKFSLLVHLKLILLTVVSLYCANTKAQNTSYTPLYTSSNFVKTIDFTKPIGEIDGSAAATASGGVSYSIPIFTSPGTNGVQPAIALVYNSQGLTGIAGFGWNISGLSAISRTGKNKYHNGIVQPVTYTTDDAFLLDGMRLNAISGANGANGTVYAGEKETFAKIISNTTISPNNPDWFQVTAKDGSVMEFGHSLNSRIMTDNEQNVMLWRMNKMIDISGNYIEFIYDNSGRDSRIQQILYTGNTNTGLVPYNQVNFLYSTRLDQNTAYDAGASLNSQYLLDKITIVHTNDAGANETVKTYRLNYGFNSVHSMLKEMVEFGGDETAASLNSTIFLYGDSDGSIVEGTTAQFTGECITGDFNADGKTDILASTYYYDKNIKFSNGYKILLNPQSAAPLYEKTLPPGHIVPENIKFSNFLASDYNRDGVDDVINVKTKFVTYPSGHSELQVDKFTIELTTATGSITQEMPMPADIVIHPSGNFFIPGDFDGDGNQDCITILANKSGTGLPTNYYGYLCTPATIIANNKIVYFTVTPGTDWTANSIASADKILPFDFNGDGKQEILVVKGTQTTILSITAYNNGNTTAAIVLTTTEIAAGDKLFPGDFNGDRKSDLLVRKTNGQWKILYSTGVSFNSSIFNFSQNVLLSGNYWDDKVVVADFNGDGKSDIVHAYPVWINGASTSSKFSMYYSKGAASSFFYEQYDYSKTLPFSDLASGDFNGDGRNDLLLKGNYYNPADIVYFKPNSQERLLQKITTGHNVTTSFTHKLMTDKSTYTYPYVYERTVALGDPLNKNPFNFIQLPIYVLASATTPDGIGGNNTTEYFYENAVLHRAAKGFLGFKKITAKNNVTLVTNVTENELNTQFALLYPVKQTATVNLYSNPENQTLIISSFDNLSTGPWDKRYLQKTDKTISKDYKYGKATEAINIYDTYGNVTSTTNKTGTFATGNIVTPVETMVTTVTYSIHNTTVPAKPDNVTVTSTREGMPPITTATTFTYAANGLLASQTNFSGLPKAVTTIYSYNNFGNVLNNTTSTSGLSSRTTSFQYDLKGRFVLQKQVASGTAIAQTTSFTYDTKWGKPLTTTSSDCLTSSYQYDIFGDLKQTILPDGNIATVNYYWHTKSNTGINNSPYKLFYRLTHYTGGKPDTKIYIDNFGREWLSQTAALKPLAIDDLPDFHTVQTTFDNRGNVKIKTNPYLPLTEAPRLTTYNYDAYNRLVSTTNDLGTTTVSYLGGLGNGSMQTVVTNPAGQISSKITDPTGKVVSATDDGGTLSFAYDSHGNQTSVNHSGAVTVSSVYDIYDKQTSMTDKDAGTTSYAYDGFGQLTQQTDANGNMYNMQYDDLGRNIVKTGPEGTTTYEYYKDINTNCSNNSLSKVTGFNGVIKEYTYDALKRIAAEKTTIDGVAYNTSCTYNAYSQLALKIYPSGFRIYNEYDANGYLSRVFTKPFNVFFANGEVDGEGRYKTYSLLTGLTTTNTYNKDYPATSITPGIQSLSYNFELNTGNLLQRTDNIKNQNEVFTYDNLNRLTSSVVNGVQQFGITYDGNTGTGTMGNITSKTDAGYYKYRSDKVHALAYIMSTPVSGQQPVVPAPVSQISYNSQTIAYTPFLKVASIYEGPVTGSPFSLQYTYGPDYQRVKSERYQGRLGLVETRYYLGDYEKQIINGVTREIHYINAPNGLCAMVVIEGGVSKFYAVHTDYLGNINKVIFKTGIVAAEQNFDAWGRQRNPDNWNAYLPLNGTPATPSWLYRGYTGHEMLPQFSLINMNGRMYDPILGRMLSPDNYVQAPFNSQNYNRYTYAMNNPLKFTDPDGNFWHIVIGAAIGGIVNLGIKAYQGRIQSWGDGFKAFGIGAAAGAVTAATGGAALSASGLSAASVSGGFISGVAGSAVGSPILGIGNNLAFGDPYSLKHYGRDVLIGGIAGGVIGGVIGGFKGNNIWSGDPAAKGRSIFSFNNTATGSRVNVYAGPSQYDGWQNANGTSTNSFAGHTAGEVVEQGVQYSDDLVRQAQSLYPRLAGKIQLHHIIPKYIGGAVNGPLVPLDAAYHQQITNAFRQAWPYGNGVITDPTIRRAIMDQVYRQFPLPPGFTY